MLRNRKNKRYNEEAHDGRGRRYNIKDKLRSERFERLRDLQELQGNQVTLRLIQRQGFDKPILVTSPDGLDLAVPAKGFVVRDVGKLVGYDRLIDVMDVRTQKNIEMTMRDWCKYYESRNRDRLLNVISLEFSHTDLATQIDSPKIVKLLDWVDLVWPKFLKESQTESTNSIDKMKYPKVQKYCLMSVKGSYTDFHIDFGGTSVWYHILRGKKIFWMAPPTELNLQAFEEWTLSGMQQDVFFGDTVEECFRVELSAGNTFFIPSGWIHAVYTVEDSLVFGGNFLHSFGIENQLKVSRIEDATKVPVKFRYPFYTEILWYVVQHYVYCLTGKSHLQNSPRNSATTTPEKNSKAKTDPKLAKKGTKIVKDESATESEHDESDKTKKKRPNPSPQKKRGRPPKRSQKTPTDDESTEIDSDYEDVKPTKTTTTCRMTKNSLLRLQYEVDEPQVSMERNHLSPNRTASKQAKSPKDENSPKDVGIDSKSVSRMSKTIEPVIKSESPSKLSSPSVIHPAMIVDTIVNETTNSVSSNDASRLNGWSGANKSTWSNPDSEPKAPSKIHITKTELNGLKLLVKHLSKLSGVKKHMPNLIRNSRALLDDCKKMIAEHESDDPELAATGIPITPDLLNPKKTDINHLIEQFFKPTEDDTSNDNSAISSKSRSDSSTLTMQHRLKYNQINEKKSVAPSSNVPNPTSSSTSIKDETLEGAQSRPRSPPTRPLSNKQYSGKTKNDKDNNTLVLPGSFADLIAATSTAKEVFNVSSADVTSSLFGLKSPSKAVQPNSDTDKVSKTSSLDIDVLASTSSPIHAKTPNEPKKDIAPKLNSPEPPRVTPAKRFITPSSNRPPVKEKLIYASAPYVSPVRASDNQRQQYNWNDQYRNNQQQQWGQTQQPQSHPMAASPIKSTEVSKISSAPPSATTHLVTGKRSPSGNQLITMQASSSNKKQETNQPTSASTTNVQPVEPKVSQYLILRKTDVAQTVANPVTVREPQIQPKATTENLSSTVVVPESKSTIQAASAEISEEPKIKKPRGPPKKSKEARQVIEASPPEPSCQPVPTSVIKLDNGGQPPLAPASKTKRVKKSKDTAEVSGSSSQNNQTRPPIIHGPSGSSNTPSQAPKAGQQYLISRPVLFNTMPAFSSAHLPHVPSTSMPVFSTPIPSTMGLHSMQPGARILWATRPGTLPTVPTPVVQPKKQVPSKTTAPQSLQTSQPDNAALLSLATTALSTAPLPTTPTLSNTGSRLPNPAQAYVVNPNLFAAQQYYNPYMQQVPMVQFAPRDPTTTALMANPHWRPGLPRPSGQLLFAPLINQTGQPRYLITQPGFMPQRHQVAPLYSGHQAATLPFVAFQPSMNPGPSKEQAKVKKVKTR